MIASILMWFFVFMVFLVPGVILIDHLIVQNLQEENKFKKWWRKHVVADYN